MRTELPVRVALSLVLSAALLLSTACDRAAEGLRSAAPTAQVAARGDPASSSGDPVEQILAEAERIDGLRGLVIVLDGETVVEGYFDGASAEDLQHVRSVTKSVTSLLIGIALDRGLLTSVDQTLAEVLGSEVEGFGPDKGRLTLRHLLTMTAGIAWNESDVGTYNRLRTSSDPLEHYLSRRFVSEPGSRWAYSSGASHVLSVVLERVTGTSTRVFAERHLFAPLDIDRYAWESMRDDHSNGSAGLELAPRDAAKIGLLVLAGGEWNGERIVSEAWIEESMRRHVPTDGQAHYGYQWRRACGPVDVRMAIGHAGQSIFVVPEWNAVIVTAARWRGLSRPAAKQSGEIQLFAARRAPGLLGLGSDAGGPC